VCPLTPAITAHPRRRRPAPPRAHRLRSPDGWAGDRQRRQPVAWCRDAGEAQESRRNSNVAEAARGSSRAPSAGNTPGRTAATGVRSIRRRQPSAVSPRVVVLAAHAGPAVPWMATCNSSTCSCARRSRQQPDTGAMPAPITDPGAPTASSSSLSNVEVVTERHHQGGQQLPQGRVCKRLAQHHPSHEAGRWRVHAPVCGVAEWEIVPPRAPPPTVPATRRR
jgi:hypothetical protein